MPRAPHPCPEQGCATPVPAGTSRCPEHTRTLDRARGTTGQRGYGAEHRALRRALTPVVAQGLATCWRCGLPIAPSDAWHLGHADDRAVTMGAEHAQCNLSAAGRARHGHEPTR